MPLDVVGSSTFGRYKKISPSQTFNMFICDDALVSFAGYEKVATMSANGFAREIFNSSKFNHLIAVVDDGVYIISPQLSVQKIGTIGTFTGAVFIADNLASQIAIADGEAVYIFNYLNSTFQKVVVDFRPVSMAFMDTYFISAAGGTNSWRLSDFNNGLLWPNDANHVGELQRKPTNTVSCIPLNSQLMIMGKTVCESWYDNGVGLFPFQRNNYYNIDYGCLAPETIAVNESLLVWLGSNEKSGLAILYSEGQTPKKLSTDGIDFKLSQIKSPTKAFGFLYKLEGHLLYQLTFTDPADNVSYVYDFNTSKFFTLTDPNMNYHIAKRIAFFNNGYYFISFKDGYLYKMSSEFETYDGNEIPAIRVCSNIRQASSRRMYFNNAVLTTLSGIGDSYQKIDLSVSQDGGYSFDQIESQYLPTVGNRTNVFQFWNLPSGQDIVFQWRFHSLNRFIVDGGEVEVYS